MSARKKKKIGDKDEKRYNVPSGTHINFMEMNAMPHSFVFGEELGRGSFGNVYKATDSSGKEVAIKVPRSENLIWKSTMREEAVYQYLKEFDDYHPNVIMLMMTIYNVMTDPALYHPTLFLVFPLMTTDLHVYTKRRGMDILSTKAASEQLLGAIQYLHNRYILHCDIKPDNIGYTNVGGVKKFILLDLGSAASTIPLKGIYFVESYFGREVVSRWYRPPEILFRMSFGPESDIWSFVCTMWEAFLGFPLFSENTEDTMILMMIVILGHPSESFLANATKNTEELSKIPNIISSEDEIAKRLETMLMKMYRISRGVDMELSDVSDFIRFLMSALRWDPKERATIEELQAHKFLTE